ncbi:MULTISPECIES: hypothetical protein [unclassified Pseudodesulfovibrio]|uniref:hypothetical protein n=1 Tax=unclassified Pseudodesulfovibrio TaxID=2661612 RepID=UPI000FEB82D3|nr:MULTISPECIES: hypothetical protein [unclassified Pseudodesulfovibrio]MCJ2163656.1 hypothetical protein [Pseudodesulfovibrio sp. S3-i]RWU06083.1 hypothetical protein DWB63_05290 [Pseudodesulfovibrio sp. S3]
MKYLLLGILAAMLMLGGCSVWDTTADYTKETWQSTRELVDPPPTIDTDSYQFTNSNQEKLAKLISPVDGPLTSLTRFVNDTDTLPGVEWLDLLLARFPWVDRVLVTDEEGTIIFMQPELPVKRITKPLVFEGVWRDLKLLTVVDYSDLGPELYIGRPYYEDIAFSGLIGVGFDPRSLLRLCPDPKELIIIHPGNQVWSLGADVDQEGLLALPWEEMLKSDVQGQVQVGNRYYTWLTRYVGEDQYVYATQSVDPNAEGSWWLF